jgi:hypothetical protein
MNTRANAGQLMCSQCDQIDLQIRRLQNIAFRILDQRTRDAIAALIAELETKKAELHPE